MLKIITLTNNKIAIVTPYHARVVTEAKARMGRWKKIESTNETTGGNAWVVDASHRSYFEELLVELFPPRESLIERVITFTANNYQTESPQVDGYNLIGFNRDRHWWNRFNAGEPLEIIHVQIDGITTGGSRKDPRLYGHCVVKLRCRPQAVATWQTDGNVEVIS